ncbi:MAG: hypothetical protein GY780_17665 [bacterium]|nr:hypothetical protein [bacterium]
MPIERIATSTGPVLGQPERDIGEVSKLDFMTLLVAQIQNQDPTSPMDNAEFTSQITQFTMLDEMSGVNDKLEESIMVGQSANNTAMLALVGKDVTVEGNAVSLEDGVASENVINSKGPGVAVVKVMDENGNQVDTYTVELTSGLNDAFWDGMDSDGNPLADGRYSLDVSVTNSGLDVPFTTLLTGSVDGLRYENNVAVVMVDSHEYYVSEIYKVS